MTVIDENQNPKPITGSETGVIKKFHGNDSTIIDIAFSNDGKYLTAVDYNKNVKTWNIFSKEEMPPRFNDIRKSPDAKYLAYGGWYYYGDISEETVGLIDTADFN